MRQREGNGFSTCLEGLVHTNLQNPSKQVEKPFPSCWHILLACSWLSWYFLYHGKKETNTTKTKRRICKGNTAKKTKECGVLQLRWCNTPFQICPTIQHRIDHSMEVCTVDIVPYSNNVIYVNTVDTLVL